MKEKMYFLFYLYLDWERCVQRENIKAIADQIYPNKVVCIDRPGDLPVGLLRRKERLLSSLPGANVRQIKENLTLIRPFFFLNDYVASFIPSINNLQCLWLRYLLNLMGLGPASDERVIIWLYSSIHWPFAKLFTSASVVYQPVDECTLTAQGNPKPHHAKMEKLMMQRCDIVFTLSDALAMKKSSLHSNIHCIGQGVSFDLFSKALGSVNMPSELTKIPHPRIGLVGNLRDWIDFQLLEKLLESHPEWSVVFIGPIDASATNTIAALSKFKNFYWVGPRPFQEIYRWLAGLDVGIIPYLQTEFTKYINPAKLYEYWAAGLPVVITKLGGFKHIKDCLWVVESTDKFIKAIEEALKTNSKSTRSDRARLAKNHSFERVAKRGLNHILNNLKKEII